MLRFDTLAPGVRAIAGLALALVLVLPAACSASSKPKQRVSHKGVGVVVAINMEKGRVKIQHETIEGYMEAMTMWFDVKDASMLSGLQPNDKVEFTITEEESADVITEIRKV